MYYNWIKHLFFKSYASIGMRQPVTLSSKSSRHSPLRGTMKRIIASIATGLVVCSVMSCVNTPFQYTKQIPVNKMPAAIFGNWNDTHRGLSVWRFGITATTFRTGDRFYKYEQVLDLGDGTYDVTVVLGEHRRRFLFRAITPSSMEYQPFPGPIFGGWIMATKGA